ncbi:hypothetical protein PROFUN_00035 [Planoprotostelium fungivorum]|uniref:Small ribosomal subunit protein mS41 n=1 Tax=Planoprotostelium fungivorum TaxID=1890364 RepID=A0A2P6P0F7_9EUKA|nr:hypothetical protein PROFUN_00035 [Planoprotostelium fungivorum]
MALLQRIPLLVRPHPLAQQRIFQKIASQTTLNKPYSIPKLASFYSTDDTPPRMRKRALSAVIQDVSDSSKVLNKIPPKEGVPQPRYGITKDVFLHKIGNDCEKYSDKFTDWKDLMTSDRIIMKNRGIPGEEPESKRMQSIAARNKEARKEARDKHAAILRKAVEKKLALKEKRREILREGNPNAAADADA